MGGGQESMACWERAWGWWDEWLLWLLSSVHKLPSAPAGSFPFHHLDDFLPCYPVLCHCDKMSEMKTSKEERFILALFYGLQVMAPWLLALGLL